jgi:MFS family permease
MESITKPEPPKSFRWVVLILISLAMFGNYYIYDAVSPMADLLATQLGFTDSNIGLLQAIYSIPNIFMVLLGGFIIDRLGTKKSTVIFALLCMLGAVITAATPKLEIMAAGRLVFGLGAESLIVAVTTAIAKWFKGKELSFAFGINLTIARLGSFAALNSPSWASKAFDNWLFVLQVQCCIGGLNHVQIEYIKSPQRERLTKSFLKICLGSENPIGTSSCSALLSIQLFFHFRHLQ